MAPVTEIDKDSSYTEANDSLQVRLQHGKRQNVEMETTSSAVAFAEAASLLSLTNIDLGDLDDTQVTEPGRKTWKEDNVAKEMRTRCPEDAAGRATAELKAITSRMLQDAAERDRGLAERGEVLVEKLTGLEKSSLRLGGQQNYQP